MTHSSRLSAFCDKVIEAGWIAAIVLVPLFFNVYSSRVFEPDKLTLLRSIALVMIGAWIIKFLEERGQKSDRSDRVTRRTPLVLPTLILIVVYVVTSALSIVPRVSFMGSYQRLQGTYTTLAYIVVFFMLLQNMRRREQLDRLITAVVMTSLPIAFYGLLQHGDGTTSIDPLPWGGDVTSRVASNMGNAIFVAAYLIMAFFMTMSRIVTSFRTILTEEESRVSDILRASGYVFIAAVQLIAFGFADSRGPLLGWLPGMFIFGLVGLLLLRVTLHSRRSPSTSNGPLSLSAASGQPADASVAAEGTANDFRYPIKTIDVLKALSMSVVCVVSAAIGAFLIFKIFATPKITLVVVAALLGGLLPLLIVAGIRRTAVRWLWASWILFSIVGGAGLALVNFSDMPQIVELRHSGTFGRLSALFETEGGTGEVRSLIWQGAVKLIQPHDPLAFPDGSSDNLNFLRPLIGYGPEAMYVAYNPFYPPDLAHLEARNASPDRSHNETWDSFVITGAIGFIAEQFLFLSIFFLALKFIGWLPNRKAAILLVGLMIAGGILGALALGVGFGVNFMGSGWPGGVTAGIVLYVVMFALFHFQISRRVYVLIAVVLIAIIDFLIFMVTFKSTNRIVDMTGATAVVIVGFAILYVAGRSVFRETADQPIAVGGHIFLLIALFGGILAHYLEISLAGIAIASTRTYFWSFAALLIVTGLRWVPADDEEENAKPVAAPSTPLAPAPIKVVTNDANVPRHKKKSRRTVMAAAPAKREVRSRTVSPWFASVLTMALIGALILVTLGYEFVNNPPRNYTVKEGDTLQMIADKFQVDRQAILQANNLTESALTPAKVIFIPIPPSATYLLWNSLTRLPYQDYRASYGALLMFLVTWLFGGLISLTELRRRNTLSVKDVLPATALYFGVSIGVALVFWLFLGSQLLNLGLLVSNTQVGTLDQYAQRVNELLTLADSVANMLTFFYLTVFLIIFGLAASMVAERRTWYGRTAGDWGLIAAVPLSLAIVIAIIVTNLNQIRADTIYKQAEPLRQQGQWDVAIAHYKRVIELAPDEDFYYLWLGAAYLEKASNAPGTQSIISPTTTFSGMLKLSIQDTYRLSRDDSLAIAQAVLTQARSLNPLNTDHSANLARLYRRWADLAAADPAKRKEQLDKSSELYRQATTLSPNNAVLWNEWATVYMSLADLAKQSNDTAGYDADIKEAQARLDRSFELDKEFDQTYLIRGQLAASLGQTEEARKIYEDGLKLKPGNADLWNSLTNVLLAQDNYTAAETITLAFMQNQPDFLPGLRMLARNVYFRQGRIQEALATQQRALQIATTNGDPQVWDDHRVLALMLLQVGQPQPALQEAQQALAAAPQEQKDQLNQVMASIQAQLGITTPTTATLPAPTPPPTP